MTSAFLPAARPRPLPPLRTVRALAICGVAASAALAGPAEGAEPASVERFLVLMGTVASVTVEAPTPGRAAGAAEAAVRALEASEDRLSTWRTDSELSRLNAAAPDHAVQPSPRLAAELAAAEACREATGGGFDPRVGPLVDAWGLRSGGRLPSPAELAGARAAAAPAAWELGDGPVVRRASGARLEEGGFGKGAALDAALAAASEAGATRAALDLGGQLAFLGAGPWPAAVADPRDRERPVVELAVPAGSLATSGNGERAVAAGGERVGHLLDPRTGRPAADFGSLTVWAASALAADCLATGLYVLGPDAALAWATRHEGVEVLVLAPQDRGGLLARATPGLAAALRPLVGDLAVAATALAEAGDRSTPTAPVRALLTSAAAGTYEGAAGRRSGKHSGPPLP